MNSTAVVPLIWGVPATVTLAPVEVNVGISARTSVPDGTVAVIAAPEIAAGTSAASPGLFATRKLNDAISLALDPPASTSPLGPLASGAPASGPPASGEG